jgi:hypothetical protein
MQTTPRHTRGREMSGSFCPKTLSLTRHVKREKFRFSQNFRSSSGNRCSPTPNHPKHGSNDSMVKLKSDSILMSQDRTETTGSSRFPTRNLFQFAATEQINHFDFHRFDFFL